MHFNKCIFDSRDVIVFPCIFLSENEPERERVVIFVIRNKQNKGIRPI